MSFFRHREIYRSDVEWEPAAATLSRRCRAHRSDESPTGYSLAGCSPAEPASASPAKLILQWQRPFAKKFPANGNLSLFYLSQPRGSVYRIAFSFAPFRGFAAFAGYPALTRWATFFRPPGFQQERLADGPVAPALLRPAAANDTSGKHLFRNVAANCRLRPNANKHSSTVRRPEIFCQESTESNDGGTDGRGSVFPDSVSGHFLCASARFWRQCPGKPLKTNNYHFPIASSKKSEVYLLGLSEV